MHTDEIMQLLAQTHWACKRHRDTVERAIANSLCFGIFDSNDRQVGFARTLTDYATACYVSDLVVDREHHGRGLGKMLVEGILSAEELTDLWGFLGTTRAAEFYEKFGFEKKQDFFMALPKTGVNDIFNVI